MKYKSYFELGGDSKQALRESGFRDFPAIVPRWGLSGGDIYVIHLVWSRLVT